jgi:hypothetical protein
MRHIKEVIEHEGGNEYKEGREDHDTRSWRGRRLVKKLSPRLDLPLLAQEASE